MIKELYYISGGYCTKEEFKKGCCFDNPDFCYFENEKKAIKEFERNKFNKYLKNYNYNNLKIEFTLLNKIVVEIDEQDFKNKCFDFFKVLKHEIIKKFIQDNSGEVLIWLVIII